MEEGERAKPVPMDLPSCQPRIFPPTSIFEANAKSAFASSSQPSNTHPPTFEQFDVTTLDPEIIGFCHQAHPSESQQTSPTNPAPFTQNDCSLSQHRATSSLKSASNSIADAEVPRKYRLNKISFTRDSHLWQTQDEPSLSQILEQERNAWLAQSPINPCTFLNDSNSEGHASDSLPASSQPTDHNLKSHQTCRSDQPSLAGSPLKRKSCFQEGSMNEGSRAVASTWDTFHSDYRLESDRESQSADLSDAEGTPRASATSRASTSSSIDINEFKPLPATPSTFKSTIRRLGQKVVNTKPARTSENVTAVPKSEKKQRRGLKKSLSTWKIFSSSASDLEDSSNLTTDDESYGGKTNYSSNTIKPRKPLINNVLSQKEVFDERKRKAELAYSEQFGTARKKQKQNDGYDHHDDSLSDWDEPTIGANSRGKSLHTSSTIRTIKSVLRKPNDNPEVLLNQDDHAVESSVPPASVPHPMFPHHNRSQSCDPNRSLDSDTDRLKKQSRGELEKENQRLRLMLRGAKISARRSAHHTHRRSSSEPCPDGSSHATVVIDRSHEQDDENIRAFTPTAIVQSSTKDVNKCPNISAANVQKPATVRASQIDFILSNDVPLLPALPGSLQQHKALLPVSGNIRPSQETATIKRRGPICQQNNQIVLPRPLSMVLEGIEGDNDEEQTHRKERAQLDGVADVENKIGRERTGQVHLSHDPGSSTQHWDWPEDVF